MTSTSSSQESLKEHFLFHSEHLLQFCSKFHGSPVEDQTESILEVKLKDLEARWNEFDSCYKKVMLAHDDLVSSRGKRPREISMLVWMLIICAILKFWIC